MNLKTKTIGLSQSYLHSTIYIYVRLLVAQLGDFYQAILSDFIISSYIQKVPQAVARRRC